MVFRQNNMKKSDFLKHLVGSFSTLEPLSNDSEHSTLHEWVLSPPTATEGFREVAKKFWETRIFVQIFFRRNVYREADTFQVQSSCQKLLPFFPGPDSHCVKFCTADPCVVMLFSRKSNVTHGWQLSLLNFFQLEKVDFFSLERNSIYGIGHIL